MLMRASKAVTLMDQDLQGAIDRTGERYDSFPAVTIGPVWMFSTI